MALFYLLSLIFLVDTTDACGAAVGGNDLFTIVQDPVFNMELSPAVRWTYFPTMGTANNMLWFFVGQANDSATALNNAQNDIRAAMIESLSAAQIPTYNVQVTSNYQAQQFENPGSLTAFTQSTGVRYGKVEGGALTQYATGGANTLAFTPYTQQVQVSVRNAQTTLQNWNIVKNNFLQKMALNYYVRFVGDITVTRF